MAYKLSCVKIGMIHGKYDVYGILGMPSAGTGTSGEPLLARASAFQGPISTSTTATGLPLITATREAYASEDTSPTYASGHAGNVTRASRRHATTSRAASTLQRDLSIV